MKASTKNTFKSIYTFLQSYRLSYNSTPEIKAYIDFVTKKRKERGWLSYEKYMGLEKHHIVPISFGGKNSIKNYVNLTHDEHILAHILFAQAIYSSRKFGRKLQNKVISTVPRFKVFLKTLLEPQIPVLMLEYFS